MITEKYCNEILQQYPEYITKDQMYRICHISKKTCLFLLESGLVPNIDSGKKTRRFKIKTVDVIQYLKDRDDYEKTISVCAESAEQAKAKTEIILFDTDLINFTDEDFICGEAKINESCEDGAEDTDEEEANEDKCCSDCPYKRDFL